MSYLDYWGWQTSTCTVHCCLHLNVGLALQAALIAGESMLTFGFAAVGLEIAFSKGWLMPFGIAASRGPS